MKLNLIKYRYVFVLVVVLLSLIPRIALLPSFVGHPTCWDADSCGLSNGLSAIRGPADALSQFWHRWAGPNKFYRPVLSIEEWLIWNSTRPSYRILVMYSIQLILHVTGTLLLLKTMETFHFRSEVAIWSACLFGAGSCVQLFMGLPNSDTGLFKPFIDLPEPLMLNIACISSLIFDRYRRSPSRRSELACCAAFLYGLLNKESEGMMPIIWFFTALEEEGALSFAKLKTVAEKFGGLTICAMLYLVMRTTVLHGVGAVYATGGKLHRLSMAVGGPLSVYVSLQNWLYLGVACAMLAFVASLSRSALSTYRLATTWLLAATSVCLLLIEALSYDQGVGLDLAILVARVFMISVSPILESLSITAYCIVVFLAIKNYKAWPIRFGLVWIAVFTILWLPMWTNMQAEYLIAPGWAMIVGYVFDEQTGIVMKRTSVWRASKR